MCGFSGDGVEDVPFTSEGGKDEHGGEDEDGREDKDGGEAKTAWEAEREQAKGNVLKQTVKPEAKGNV